VDTLYLREGIYAEKIDTNKTPLASGTGWANPTTIASYFEETAILRPSETEVVTIWANSYIVLDGLIIDGANLVSTFPYSNGLMTIGREGSATYGANHILVTNSEFVNAPDGMFVGTSTYSNDIRFINNKLHDSVPFDERMKGGTSCGQSICWGYVFYWGASGGLIEGNEIYNFPSFGIHMYSSGCDVTSRDHPCPSGNVVRGNVIHDFSTSYWQTPPLGAFGAGDPRARGILLTSGDGNVASDNIVYNGSIGMGTTDAGANMQFYNNIVFNMTGIGLAISNRDAIAANNMFFEIDGPAIAVFSDNASLSNNMCDTAGPGCDLVGDPKFFNAAAGTSSSIPTAPR
jgi:hypothetical protein